jgi:hypothetical protein
MTDTVIQLRNPHIESIATESVKSQNLSANLTAKITSLDDVLDNLHGSDNNKRGTKCRGELIWFLYYPMEGKSMSRP